MARPATSRPRMATIYAPGAVRARRWYGDVRGYRPPSGWSPRADLTDIHPIACRVVAHRDEETTRSVPRPGRSAMGAAVAAPGVQSQQPNQAVAFAAAYKHQRMPCCLNSACSSPDTQPNILGLSSSCCTR